MELKQEELQFVIAQILLADPTSEKPHVHEKRKHFTKTQVITRINALINLYKDTEVDIDLTPYLETIKYLREIKDPTDYESLLHDIVTAYE
ncbi:MAG TPA: hypothetical protein VGC17_02420 [Lactovum miscens]|uniref:hypothetical protein n=1 Tax=Lactovum miscens TaxID=190387 RepID=UPI002EDA82EF